MLSNQILVIPLGFFTIIMSLICYWSCFKNEEHQPSDKIKNSDWYK